MDPAIVREVIRSRSIPVLLINTIEDRYQLCMVDTGETLVIHD